MLLPSIDEALLAPQAGSSTPRPAARDEPAAMMPLASRLPLLSAARLRSLPADVQRPSFDPAALRPGIVHLGCGAFHRAHQALITQHAIAAAQAEGDADGLALRWGIVSASLRSATTIGRLQGQGGLYTVIARGADTIRAEVVGTLRQTVFAPQAPRALAALLADPAIRIVTLTVTAGGYGLHPVTGRLDLQQPDIAADIAARGAGGAPRSAVGLLVAGLAARRAAGHAPPVVLSCDNLSANGRTLRQACIDFAACSSDGLSAWIAQAVQFPCTVVDRIVPSTDPGDQRLAEQLLGCTDAAPVVAEPYRQWVIERFDGPRPMWEAAGAAYVSDAGPWEASKLRLLNGGHLVAACLGLLAGLETVAEVAADPVIADFLLRYMLQEQLPTLPPSDHDIPAYARELLARWRNPHIVHRLERVGRDASAKLPARLLASLCENLAAGRAAPCTTLAVAAWISCMTGRRDGRDAPLLSDPLSARLAEIGRQQLPPSQRVDAVVDGTPIFPEPLRRSVAWREALGASLATLQWQGPHGAVTACLAGGAA